MKTKQLILSSLLVLFISHASQAEDIDIYSGTTSNGVPNVMFVVDNPSSQNNNASACSYSASAQAITGTATPSNNNKALGQDQCALANIVADLPTNADGSAVVNLGITTVAGVYFKLTPINNAIYTGPDRPAGIVVGTTTNRQAFILAVKALAQATGKSGQGSELQETWAYYTGGNGGTTGVGILSGTDYTAAHTTAPTTCAKNYIIYLSNVDNANASHPQEWDNTEMTKLTSSIANAVTNHTLTTAQGTTLGTKLPNMPAPIGDPGEGREWARFMKSVDVNTTATGTGMQSIITYSVATGFTAVPPAAITHEMENYIKAVSTYGGGKYYPAGDDASVLQSSILKILNEVQAVNSVFSSSSLPVSVNAQGTYLNQIYMGMFRPDPDGNPRWAGNLKQYHFVATRDSLTQLISLSLSDSLDASAINPATGFITPSAVSYWTCGGNPSVRACSPVSDVVGGFWANDSLKVSNSAGGAYDSPDGEWVDKGGAAQIVRLANLTANYATAAGTATNPRKLYTYCPSGAGCNATLSDSSNAFATANAGITASQFGSASYPRVSSIVRTGTSALVTTLSAHGYSTGNSVTINGATQTEYNVTQNITVNSPTTFTITGLGDSPTSPSTGTYTAALHNSTTKAISSVALATSTTANANGCASGTIPNINCNRVTVTLPAHGYSTGNLINIAGVTTSPLLSPNPYSGSFVITVIDNNTFTYNVPVTPTSPSVNAYSAQLPVPAAIVVTDIKKVTGNCTVTATAHGYSNGDSVTISGNTAWNGTYTVASAAANTFQIALNCNSTGTGGSVVKNNSVISIAAGNISRASATATTATVTGITASAFSNGNTVVLAKVSGSNTNETEYVPLSGNKSVVITCAGTCTSFTFPISTNTGTAATLTTSSPTAALAGSPVTIPAGAITRAVMGTTATVTGVVNTFINGDFIDISASGAPVGTESAYLSPAAGWQITCAAAGCNPFTFGPVTLTPTSPATGAHITAYQASTPPDKNPLINWVRGEDNFGDETGPGGGVTIRPSLHGDVLHSRPVAVNYGTHAISITATSDALGTRTATASAANITTISALDATARSVTFANGQSCMVTVASATTFTYSATNCGAAGAQTASVGPTVVVYYGGNDGVFRAVNGNQTAAMTTAGGTVPPGGELWGFIPTELFSKLVRLRDNSPILDLPSTIPGITPTPQKKSYFADGSTGIYQKLAADGTTAKAYLYLTMRRGGEFIYALDVTNPADPRYLWKINNTGDFTELGQTWSAPKVALIKGYCGAGVTCSAANPPAPVLIFGAGYDTAEDTEPAGTDTMGRGIYIADAETGALIWRATYGAASACSAVGTAPATCTVSGMNYSIPADITLMDSDYDGYIDRLYAVDVGGNIWRVDTQRSAVNYTPDYWRVHQVASLGGSCCPLRKFFYPVDVVPAGSYDAIIAGSGDREHPLYTNAAVDKQNRIFMIKDLTGNDGSGLTTIVRNKLFNATSATYSAAAASIDGTAPNKGYYIDLLNGEKVVNAPLTVAGYTYLGTNQPTASNTCSANLGVARGYRLGPLSGAYTSTVFAGGGLPPSPVAGVVSVTVAGESTPSLVPFVIGGGGDPGCVGADCSSALGGAKPTINVPTTRTRTYWYQEVD